MNGILAGIPIVSTADIGDYTKAIGVVSGSVFTASMNLNDYAVVGIGSEKMRE